MDAAKHHETAERIVERDGATGVAVLLAAHERLLQTVRAIYDEGAPRRMEEGRRPSEVIATMRDLALTGLKLPDDLKVRMDAWGDSPSYQEAMRDAEARSMALEGQRDGARMEADKLAAELKQERAARRAIAVQVRILVSHLAGEQPTWWVEATRAIDSLERLLNAEQATDAEG